MGKKSALLIGLNYIACHPRMQLRGCHNDVQNMRNYLIKHRNYSFEEVKLALDYDLRSTSKEGIIEGMYELVADSYSQDLEEIFLHYSGHGTQRDDETGDEEEGDDKDQVLVPWDCSRNGYVTDEKINQILARINPKTRVICLFDCCHSATMADLPYRYDVKMIDNDQLSIVKDNVANGKQTKPKIITLSGCRDCQTSADAYNVQGRRSFTGAMTSCFLECVKENASASKSLDIFKLFQELHKKIRSKNFDQRPVLCSSHIIEDEESF